MKPEDVQKQIADHVEEVLEHTVRYPLDGPCDEFAKTLCRNFGIADPQVEDARINDGVVHFTIKLGASLRYIRYTFTVTETKDKEDLSG
ncbi:hypothetical protein UFOVP276_201 [uncultured Caudovirales phage]|uniref:Uncharacterized protein n=1 Tax=uncultured Caudovirales phage TaxID=2100421 RepID=A0A6J5LLU1_9CAUD|nr:hypothetical protein UFOVP127_95 [uncultured Caudovirales phage]CAB4135245.1 hypothetical protein UFOVP276_201 [uncultured Caudovirales phage]